MMHCYTYSGLQHGSFKYASDLFDSMHKFVFSSVTSAGAVCNKSLSTKSVHAVHESAVTQRSA
jgi:hypothetical protein